MTARYAESVSTGFALHLDVVDTIGTIIKEIVIDKTTFASSTIEPQLPHVTPGNFITGEIGGASKDIFGIGESNDTIYIGDTTVDNTTPTIARGAWDFQGTAKVLEPTEDMHIATKKYVDDHSGGGSGTFTGLSDTPADYSNAEGHYVKVKNDGTGLEFLDGELLLGKGEIVTFEVGKYLRLLTLPAGTSGRFITTMKSAYYETCLDIYVGHTYDDIKYELSIAQYNGSDGPQFSNVIFTHNNSTKVVDVYLRIDKIKDATTEDVYVDTKMMYTNSRMFSPSMPLTIVDSRPGNIRYDISVPSIHFRTTNLPYTDLSVSRELTVNDTLYVYGDQVITGTLDISEPTADSNAATKKYVDDHAGGGSFLDLSDTPADYTDMAGKTLRVNDDGTGVVFTDDVEVGSARLRYQRFDTDTDLGVIPAHGHVKFDAAYGTDYSAVTQVLASYIDRVGDDDSGFYGALDNGDVLLVTDTNGVGVSFNVTGVPTINNTDETALIPVTHRRTTAQLPDNKRIVIAPMYLGKKTFASLNDVNVDYTGNAGKATVVNDTEDGITLAEVQSKINSGNTLPDPTTLPDGSLFILIP
jgi:hypothetical protein